MSSTVAEDMPCDKLEQTVISVSHVYRHICATDHPAGRVYRQMSAYVNPAGRVVSSTKMAIHTTRRVCSIFLDGYGRQLHRMMSSLPKLSTVILLYTVSPKKVVKLFAITLSTILKILSLLETAVIAKSLTSRFFLRHSVSVCQTKHIVISEIFF